MATRPINLLPGIFLALILSVPTLSIFVAWLFPAGRGFSYMIEHGLVTDYTQNSLIIACFTGLLALTIGTLTASLSGVVNTSSSNRMLARPTP